MKFWLQDSHAQCTTAIHDAMGGNGYALVEVDGDKPTTANMTEACKKVGMVEPIAISSNSFISPHHAMDTNGNMLQIFPVG